MGTYGYGYILGYPEIHSLAFLASSLCCVGALAGLSSQKTARLGNALGMIGVSSGVVSTLGYLSPDTATLIQMGAAMGTGSLIGVIVANKIKVRVQLKTDKNHLLGHRFAPISRIVPQFCGYSRNGHLYC